MIFKKWKFAFISQQFELNSNEQFMTQLVQYTFEPIIIPQEEIDYYKELCNNVLNNFIRNFQEHIEVIDNQLRFLNHQFFTITRMK